MNANAMAHIDISVKGNVWKEVDLRTEAAIRANVVGAAQHRMRTDPDIVGEDAIRSDMGRRVNLGTRRNDCRRVNAGGEGLVRKEKWQHLGEGDPRIRDTDQDFASGSESPLDNNG